MKDAAKPLFRFFPAPLRGAAVLLLGLLFGGTALHGETEGNLTVSPPSAETLPPKARTFYEAVALYMARDYENAYVAFDRLFRVHMGDVLINFYLGLSASATKRYDTAISAFERVLFAEPKNARAHFELGKVYFATGLFEQAEIEFRRALFFADTEELIALIQKYIAAALSYRKRSFLSASASFGVFQDDNVNQGNDYSYTSASSDPNNPAAQDTGHNESLSFHHLYDIGGPKEYYLLTTASIFYRTFSEHDDQNFRFYRIATGPFYRTDTYTLTFPVGTEYMEYGGDPYLHGYDLGAVYRIPWGKDRRFSLEATHKQTRYIPDDEKENDSDQNEISAEISNLIPDQLPGLTVSALFRSIRAVKGSEPTVDNDQQEYAIRYSRKLHPALTLAPSYHYRHRDYRGEQRFWFDDRGFTRSDDTTTLRADLTYRISQPVFVRLGWMNTENRSNHPIYSYQKNRFQLTLSYIF